MNIKSEKKHKKGILKKINDRKKVFLSSLGVSLVLFSGINKFIDNLKQPVKATDINDTSTVSELSDEELKGVEKDYDPEQIIEGAYETFFGRCVSQEDSYLRKKLFRDLYIEDRNNIKLCELQKIPSAIIKTSCGDTSVINYCSNLQYLSIIIDTNTVDSLLKIDPSNLRRLKGLEITGLGLVYSEEEIEKFFEFLDRFDNLDILFLDSYASYNNDRNNKTTGYFSYHLPLEKFYNMKHPKKLKLQLNWDSKIDYTKFNDVEELIFDYNMIYDIPIYLTTEDIEKIERNGTKISVYQRGIYYENGYNSSDVKDGLTLYGYMNCYIFSQIGRVDVGSSTRFIDHIEELKEICKRLDDIIDQLDIKDEDSEQNKFDKILLYTIENCTYDSAAKKSSLLWGSFYRSGYLYGALYSDTQICGNYAALFQALAYRAKLESYLVNGPGHLYNLVKLGNRYYYSDPTWADDEFIKTTKGQIITAEQILSGEESTFRTENIPWSMEDPNNYPGMGEEKDSHNSNNLTENIMHALQKQAEYDEKSKQFNEIFIELDHNVLNLSEKEQVIVINGKFYTIATILLLAISSIIDIRFVYYDENYKKMKDVIIVDHNENTNEKSM